MNQPRKSSLDSVKQLSEEFSNACKKLEARISRFHVRMQTQVDFIDSQRQLVDHLTRAKRSRELERATSECLLPPKASTVASETTVAKKRNSYYGTLELGSSIVETKKDMKGAMEALANMKPYIKDVQFKGILAQFAQAIAALETSLNEIQTEHEVDNDIDSFYGTSDGSTSKTDVASAEST